MSILDHTGFRAAEAKCTQEHAAPCAATCPLHVDARALCAAVQKGDFTAGRTLLEKLLPLPRILAKTCDAPCTGACVRKALGGSIDIRALEEACMRLGEEPPERRRFIKKKREIAVFGANYAGLTAAVELARRKYIVNVYEPSDSILPGVQLDAQDVQLDTAFIEKLGVVLHLGCTEQPADSTAEVIFVAQNLPADELTRQTDTPNVFAGNCEDSVIQACSVGRRAAISMDWFLQEVSMTNYRENEGAYQTRLVPDLDGVQIATPIPHPDAYTAEQAVAEADRCIQCECLTCVKACAYLQHFKKIPRVYAREIYNNMSMAMGTRLSNGIINGCALCGQCTQLCPHDFDMAALCKEARDKLVETNHMPAYTFEFALLDMAYSNSEDAFIAKHQPGTTASAYALFPGCQLAACAPGIVTALYDDLQKRLSGGVALFQGCCGILSDWAGRPDLYAATRDLLRSEWEKLGKPKLITACPTCFATFQKDIPEFQVVGIWEVLNDIGLPPGCQTTDATYAIHDACNTRNDAQLQDSVRKLAKQLGVTLVEPKYTGKTTPCCGWGGGQFFANREIAQKTAQKRIGESDMPYLAYCINCRDRMQAQGSDSRHLLELVYGACPNGSPSFSARRYNRAGLKHDLLQKYWGEEQPMQTYDFTLAISDEVRTLMEQRLILEQDLYQTLQHYRETGAGFLDPKTGFSIASYQVVNTIFWVHFTQDGDVYTVHKAYCHRMTLK